MCAHSLVRFKRIVMSCLFCIKKSILCWPYRDVQNVFCSVATFSTQRGALNQEKSKYVYHDISKFMCATKIYTAATCRKIESWTFWIFFPFSSLESYVFLRKNGQCH